MPPPPRMYKILHPTPLSHVVIFSYAPLYFSNAPPSLQVIIAQSLIGFQALYCNLVPRAFPLDYKLQLKPPKLGFLNKRVSTPITSNRAT